MFNIDQLPEGFEDALYTDIDIYFDLRDRLKILLGYTVMIKTQTLCQHKPGNARSESIVRLWKPKRHGIAQVYGAGEIKPKIDDGGTYR